MASVSKRGGLLFPSDVGIVIYLIESNRFL